ncbi:MAG: AAA family ATPase [Bacillota bacterium]|nr:AAA family ATPase [Bacillota bacterium]
MIMRGKIVEENGHTFFIGKSEDCEKRIKKNVMATFSDETKNYIILFEGNEVEKLSIEGYTYIEINSDMLLKPLSLPEKFEVDYSAIENIHFILFENEDKNNIGDEKQTHLIPVIFMLSDDEIYNMDKCKIAIKHCLKKYKDNFTNEEKSIIVEVVSSILNEKVEVFGIKKEMLWKKRTEKLFDLDEETCLLFILESNVLSANSEIMKIIEDDNIMISDVIKKFVRSEALFYYDKKISNITSNFSNKDAAKIMQCKRIIKAIEDLDFIISRETTREKCLKFFNEWKPKKIVEFLNSTIIGQEDACEKAAMALYNHVKLFLYPNLYCPKENYLFIGRTGTGKTELFRQLKKISPLPVIIVDSSVLTSEGFSGVSKTGLLAALRKKYGAQFENSILVFDEADKIIMPEFDSEGMDININTQSDLLKLAEEEEIIIGRQCINAKYITLIMLGSFDGIDKFSTSDHTCGFLSNNIGEFNELPKIVTLRKSLLKFGMIPELLGRMTVVVRMKDLNKDAFVKILFSNITKQIEALYEVDHIKIDLNIDAQVELLSMNDESLGVRNIRNILTSAIQKKVINLIEESETEKIISISADDLKKL